MLKKIKARLALALALAVPMQQIVPTYAVTTDEQIISEITTTTLNDGITTLSNDGIMTIAEEGDLGVVRMLYQIPENVANFTSTGTTLGTEWSGISFDYVLGNTYTIEYFIMNTLKPVKVVHEMFVKGSGDLEVTTRIYSEEGVLLADTVKQEQPEPEVNEDGELEEVEEIDVYEYMAYSVYNPATATYRSYVPDNDGDGSIVTTGDVNATFAADRGNTIYLNNYSMQYRYVAEPESTERGRMYLTTNGVSEGTTIKFTVSAGGVYQELEILEEITGFGGTPTHYMLDDNGDIMDDVDIFSPQSAGDRPGFNITFDHPREITTADNGTYQISLIEGGEDISAKINLTSYSGKSIAIDLDLDNRITDEVFDVEEGELGYGLSEQELGFGVSKASSQSPYDDGRKLYYDNNTTTPSGYHVVTITADQILHNEEETQSDDSYEDFFIQWSDLGISDLMSKVELVLNQNVTGGRFANTTFTATDAVYTYLGFEISRTGYTSLEIVYTPYENTNTDVLYYVYDTPISAVNSLNYDSDPRLVAVAQGGQGDRIPVTVNLSSIDNFFSLKVDPKVGSILDSQTLQFDATAEADIPPLTPSIESINNIYSVPPLPTSDSTQPQALGFDITWTAPQNTDSNPELSYYVDDGDLYYELLLYNSESTSAADRVYSKVFKVQRGESPNAISVDTYMGEAGDGISSTDRYDPYNNTFSMENVILKPYLDDETIGREEYDKWFYLPKFGGNNYSDTYGYYLTGNDYPEASDDPSNPDEEQTLMLRSEPVPGTYYFTMRAIYDRFDDGRVLTYSNESNPVAVTFNVSEDIVPVVTEINAVTDSDGDYGVKFDVVDISDYVTNMLDPIGWELGSSYERTYEVYLYQEVSGISLSETNYSNAIDAGTFSGVTNTHTITDAQLDSLRAGEIIQIDIVNNLNSAEDTEKPSIYYKNLDPNEVYYVSIRTVIKPVDRTWAYSVFSSLETFTTGLEILPPTAAEQAPPAPTDFYIIDYPTNTSVQLGWTPPEYEVEEGEQLYFELVRSKGAVMEDALLEIGYTLDEILGATANSAVAFSTYNSNVMMYDQQGNTTELDQISALNQVIDYTLTPNRIYYYYVRSVATSDGTHVSSDWIRISVTTDPVERPINLAIEKIADYGYDGAHEAVISFMASIPEEGVIPTDYDFEFAIKGPNDNDYVTVTTQSQYQVEMLEPVTEATNVPDGYQSYVYKITGLSYSERYDIKIRVLDYTIELEPDEDTPTSLYSDILVYRTEYDEEDDNSNKALEDYLTEYDRLTNELKSQDYWTLEEDEDVGVYKYRSAYLQTLLSIDNAYSLVAGDVDRLEYYFPAETFNWVNDRQTVLQINMDPFVASLRPYMLDDTVDEISDAITDVAANYYKGYYIHLQVELSNDTSMDVNPLTPVFDISMDVVMINDHDTSVEDDILYALVELIEERRELLEEELTEALAQNIIDSTILDKLLYDQIDYVIEAHKEEATDIVDNAIEESNAIKEVETAILLQADLNSTDALGYTYDKGDWYDVFTFSLPNGYALEIVDMGKYVFCGTYGIALEIPTIEGGSTIIKQYQLGTIFDLENGLDDLASKQQIYDTFARIMGAERDADSVNYLSNQGLDGVNGIFMTSTVRQDDYVYLLMQIYEDLYNTDVSRINIKNMQGISNIGDFASYYREYIYAAVELGIIDTQSGVVSTSSPMVVSDVIETVTKLMSK